MTTKTLPLARSARVSRGWTLTELLIVAAILAVLAGVSVPVWKAFRQNAMKVDSARRMANLATAFTGFASENGGLMPWEDAVGGNSWASAAKPENKDVWYNALPTLMNAPSVGALATDPGTFYNDAYPLYFKGAKYPDDDKKLSKPFFAVAMNSRIQRRGEDGQKKQGSIAHLSVPARTVIFFERGLPKEDKTMGALGGYDGTPKGNAANFVARYNQKGLLIFADGHAELVKASEIITSSGMVLVPQEAFIWTPDPAENPN
ncbi:MAG: type II secretion system protein [Verrucomicrobiales bacterium]